MTTERIVIDHPQALWATILGTLMALFIIGASVVLPIPLPWQEGISGLLLLAVGLTGLFHARRIVVENELLVEIWFLGKRRRQHHLSDIAAVEVLWREPRGVLARWGKKRASRFRIRFVDKAAVAGWAQERGFDRFLEFARERRIPIRHLPLE